MAGERDLIRTIRTRAATTNPAAKLGSIAATLRLGIGDDCAVLRPLRNHDILVTTDFSLEGRHFRRDWHPAASAGHRCLARGLSDLAAMGAAPIAAFLSLALPADTISRAPGRNWVDAFLEGLLALAKTTATPLAGGDTATAPGEHILADIVLLGSTPRGQEIRRSTARPGDNLYVTGTLGGSAAELAALARHPKRFAKATPGDDHPHPSLFPQPRLATGVRLRTIATAAIDISDGLSTDLHHLCEESALGAIIEAAALPHHPLLTTLTPYEAENLALHGGEDYELLFTAGPLRKIPNRIAGIPITRIGTVTANREILLARNGKTSPLKAAGWEHTL